jgi:nucleotide-binding universal stress UspA family protein
MADYPLSAFPEAAPVSDTALCLDLGAAATRVPGFQAGLPAEIALAAGHALGRMNATPPALRGAGTTGGHHMPAQFQHLLVPLDLSEANARLLDVVYDIVRQSGARVTLLHVIEAIGDEADDELEEFYASLEPEARGKLAVASRRFAEAGVAIEQQVLIGRRMPTIVQFAIDQQVDLIIVDSPRLDLQNPQQGLSNLGYQVSMFCQCPVLLLKDR